MSLCWFIILVISLSLKESRSDWQKNSEPWKTTEYDLNKDLHSIRPVKPLRKEINDDAEKAFEDFAREVIAHDELSIKYCEKNTVTDPQEVYSHKYYKLILPFKDYNPDYVQIKIKHRVIYTVIGLKLQSNNEARFEDIRRLSDFVNTRKATWAPTAAGLQITIPYKFKMNKASENSCHKKFDIIEQEIIVPRDKSEKMWDVVDVNNNTNDYSDNKTASTDQKMVDHIFGTDLLILQPAVDNNEILDMKKNLSYKVDTDIETSNVPHNNGVDMNLLDQIMKNISDTQPQIPVTTENTINVDVIDTVINNFTKTNNLSIDQNLLDHIFEIKMSVDKAENKDLEKEQTLPDQNSNIPLKDQKEDQNNTGIQINQNLLDLIFNNKSHSQTDLIYITNNSGTDMNTFQNSENTRKIGSKDGEIDQNLLDLIFNNDKRKTTSTEGDPYPDMIYVE